MCGEYSGTEGIFGKNQGTGGVAVEAVDTSERTVLTLCIKISGNTVCQRISVVADGRMYRHIGRFVYDQDIFVFIKNGKRHRNRDDSVGINSFQKTDPEMISGQKTLRAYTQEERVIQDMDVQNKKLVDAYYKTDYYASIMGPATNAINNLALALISVFGAILYLHGSISIGSISAFVLYSRKFTGPIREIAEIYGELQSSLAAAERVFKVIDEPPEPADLENAAPLENAQGDVELSHVSFGYQKDQVILKDFSMKAPKGSLIAIVGPTGAGKTTFINLLMRFYDIGSGSILVDGRNISDITRKSLRLSYSMVLQDTWLFYGTIYENIAYGRPDATREEVVAAAKAARIHTYIESLPQGYDTLLIDDGTNISKGQKQLLTIARALLMQTPMLILDEATSNVDTRTEHQIQAAMRALMADKTCFVVAHRLSTIRNADCILVVRDGNVVERGTHEELMRQKGFYYEMHQAQYR